MKKYFIAGLMVFFALAAVAVADVVRLKDGTVHDCEIVKQTADSVSIRIISGTREAVLTIPRTDVASIEKKESVVTGYRARKAAASTDNAAELKLLGQWCRENGLDELAEVHMERARELFKRDYLEKHPERRCEPCEGLGRVPCKACKGTGKTLETCPKCDGFGRQECSRCDGTGRITCKECDGKGEVVEEKRVKVGGRYEKNRVVVPCKKCEGRGYLVCKKCDGKGRVDCKYCDGTGKAESKCENCDAEGSITCSSCGGPGIQKEFARDFEKAFEALGRPVEKPDPAKTADTNKTEPDKTEKPEPPPEKTPPPEKKEKVVLYAHAYQDEACERPLENLMVPAYSENRLRPDLRPSKWIDDNAPLEALSVPGNTSELVKVATADGDVLWVESRYLRKRAWKYESCGICEGNGYLVCPACGGSGNLENRGRLFPCRVCDGKGRVKCARCGGVGKKRRDE